LLGLFGSLYYLTVIKRRNSKAIYIGDVKIGGGAPVVVQSMTKTDTRNIKTTISQIKELADCGCEIIRVAVPDMIAANNLKTILKNIPIPLIADIHFDYRLALAAIKAGVQGLRLNPGNINEPDKIASIIKKAKERDIPIRIGVNAGSLPESPQKELSIPQRMVTAALGYIKQFEDLDFDLIKVSLKAFDVPTTIQAYRSIADKIPYPLHIGITEAGTARSGMIRSSVGISILLSEGLGDTLRVSLTANPIEEVYTGYEILKSLNLREQGPILVSCPTCGRTEINLAPLAEQTEKHLSNIKKTIKVAVMGCIVNGPGEAKDADVGIAGGKGKAVLFKKGKTIKTVDEKDILSELFKEIDSL
jgi:(E)-4-hydroxy-3-methylbut-2-enyl-diphosphate synthase